MEETLKKLWYDPKFGLSSAQKFYDKLKEKGVKITLQKVKDFVKSQEVAQVFKPRKRAKQFDTIISPGPGNNYQMDLMIYDRFEYQKYKYILVVIDVYSRFVMARALTNRKSETVRKAVEEICDKNGWPQNINMDNEFHYLEPLFEKHSVKMWFSDPGEINKNAIVERVNRTLAQGLQRVRQAYKRYDWAKYLPDIVESYNETKHGTTKMKPIDLFKNGKESQQTINKVIKQIKVGDTVRIVKEKGVFQKGDVATRSKRVYQVVGLEGNRFKLKNPASGKKVKRTFKEYELERVGKTEKLEIKEEAEEKEHKETKAKKKVTRAMKRHAPGVESVNVKQGKRERKTWIDPETAIIYHLG